MADDEARRLADEHERLYCYGDIDPSEVERSRLEDWAYRAYRALWRLGQPDWAKRLTPSADVPACRDEDPAWSASLAACYPDPPEYAHPEEPGDEQSD